MLKSEKYAWRELGTLSKAVGASEQETRELLVAIGARASTKPGREMWGLTARHGRSGATGEH
jgi:hypothetical protein